jgi:phage terminase large subunit GpA-like protein
VHWPIKGPRENTEPFDREYFRQATAEEQVKRYRGGIAEWVWDAKKRRNEATDCSVYSLAAIRILQQHFGVSLKDPAKKAEPEPHKQPEKQRYIPRRRGYLRS